MILVLVKSYPKKADYEGLAPEKRDKQKTQHIITRKFSGRGRSH